ncbi:MAG: transcriptional repressor LexA [Candidatus Omnitrophica bacterium]|nr:transcriptional repressor LexA [Candidatus Omnitrophota bacterium]
MLTKRQKQVLDFIKKYIDQNDYAPSLEEIRKHLRLSSVSTAHYHVEALKNMGFLRKDENQPRALDVFAKQKLVQIPLLGRIAAGAPIEAIEDKKESIAVPQDKIKTGNNCFALQVVGKSMIDENIDDGDIVIVRKQETAENGQKVVALINNSEATLKQLYRERNRIRLQPANPKMHPIFVNSDDLVIQGIVIDIIKSAVKEEALEKVNHTIPKKERPKGGCELLYPEKQTKEKILFETLSSELKLIKKYGSDSKTKNKLILGDNLGILKNFYNDPEIKGKIDLIYIDPPFGTGQEFVGYEEEKSYSDKLINVEFLEFLRKRLIFLRELLSENGSIYLHIDQKIGHYIKIIMDEVFGEECFRNDITRIKCNPKNFERKAYGNIKDVIYFYSKSKSNGNDPMYWSDYRLPLSEEEIEKQFPKIDKYGRRYATTPLHAKGETKNGPTGKPWKGLKPPKGRHWRYPPEELTRLDKAGLIEWSETNNPRKIIYADENRGKKIQDIWDFRDPGFVSESYPTEKNEELLKQIILCSSKEGDLVLDCFCGSGTTLVAAEKLKRYWIGIDSNESAIKTAEKRLLALNKKQDLFKKPTSFGLYKTI